METLRGLRERSIILYVYVIRLIKAKKSFDDLISYILRP